MSNLRMSWLALVYIAIAFLISACCGMGEVQVGQDTPQIVFISDRKLPFHWSIDSLRRELTGLNNVGPFGPVYNLNIADSCVQPIQGAEWSLPTPAAFESGSHTLAFGALSENSANPSNDGHIGLTLLRAGATTTRLCNYCTSPSWSPDGSKLIYLHTNYWEGVPSIIQLYDRTSGSITPLVEVMPHGSPPIDAFPLEGFWFDRFLLRTAWSADGQDIVYEDYDDEKGWGVWMISTSGGQPTMVTSGRQPAISPVGSEIAFVRDGDIWIQSIETGVEQVLVDDPIDADWPTWSPDGNRLAFVSRRDGNREIYVINRDGTQLQNLTNNPAEDLYPNWTRNSTANGQTD